MNLLKIHREVAAYKSRLMAKQNDTERATRNEDDTAIRKHNESVRGRKVDIKC